MKTYKIIQFLFCIICSSTVFSQIKDKESKSIRIPAEISKTKKDSTPLVIKVAPKLDIKDDKSSNKPKEGIKKFVIKDADKPFSLIDNDGLKSPSEIFEKRWNKEAEKGGIIRTMSDQYLGEHRVDTKFVNIICRDHEYPDGDRVEIQLNGITVKSNLLLTGSYRRVEVDLADGKNTIDIIALNQGESGPNTAEFLVYDDKGNLISSKEWNLLTGVKATIVFINEKVIIKEKTTQDKQDEASNN